MKFSELNLQINNDIKTIEVNGNKISIKQYLPAAEKNLILASAIENANGDVLNTFALDAYFHLFIVLKYTDIEFDDDMNLLDAYDILESNGIINQVISAMNSAEYKDLRDHLIELQNIYSNYNNSISSIVAKLGNGIKDLSSYLEKLKPEDIETFANTIREQLSVIQGGQN